VNGRDIAKANGIGRAVLGAAMIAAPGAVTRLWMDRSGSVESKVLGRTHGVRDIALGAGLVWALERDEPAHAWMAGAALSDLVDAGATLAYWNELPRAGRAMVLALATSSAVQMGTLAARAAR
jgi:hypothetical protein